MASLPIKTKKGTVIHRTTSESLRLSDCELIANHVPSSVHRGPAANSRKKSQTSPSCSFQITGVSLTRVDLGEDSADDLDESHTDDISRITDNETPSFSEDSKDTDDHLVQPEIVKDDQLGSSRFKVVKIESVAPFSRGRWTCFDYLDQTESVADEYSYVFYNKCDENGHKRATNPSNLNFWDPHCQDYMCRTASGVLPRQIYVPIACWQPKTTNNKARTHRLVHNDARHQCKQEHHSDETEAKGGRVKDTKSVASVSCTATIDTKIENALDVVKTHLTRAVRLEVEELKIKINELVDRISYLEYENDLLRANVAPDVLARLGGDK